MESQSRLRCRPQLARRISIGRFCATHVTATARKSDWPKRLSAIFFLCLRAVQNLSGLTLRLGGRKPSGKSHGPCTPAITNLQFCECLEFHSLLRRLAARWRNGDAGTGHRLTSWFDPRLGLQVTLCGRIRRTGFTERRLPSFGLDVGCSDYLGPLLIFVGNEFSEIGGCHRPRLHAQISEPRYQLGIGKTCIGLAVDFADDLGRRVLREHRARTIGYLRNPVDIPPWPGHPEARLRASPS